MCNATPTPAARIVAEIWQDESPESPREWSNVGTLYAEHHRYNLSDKGAVDPRDIPPEEIAVMLPVYMYEHSCVVLSCGSFAGRAPHAEWDSGCVGAIYVTRDKMKAEGWKRLTPKVRDILERNLRGEIETFSQYVNGDVYGFTLYDVTTCGGCGAEHKEMRDSCGGFYGRDVATNGMLDHCSTDAERAALTAAE